MSPERDHELAAIRGAIRGAGLRCTAPRVAVLDLLRRTAGPATRSALAAALIPLGFDGSTVYRNLRDLITASIVACVDLGDRVHRYELRPPGTVGDHPHFVCTLCGAIACLNRLDVKVTVGRDARQRLKVADVAPFVLRGICRGCESAARDGDDAARGRMPRAGANPPRTRPRTT